MYERFWHQKAERCGAVSVAPLLSDSALRNRTAACDSNVMQKLTFLTHNPDHEQRTCFGTFNHDSALLQKYWQSWRRAHGGDVFAR